MMKLAFTLCLVATFSLASSLWVPAPGSRGVPPEAQCRDDKQNCPLGQYCKGGVCHRMVMCHDDSGCSPTQCCMKSGPYGICSDAPGAGQLCLVPNPTVPSCPCRSGTCKPSPYSKDVGTCG